jgi:hypothetical protein
MVDLKMAQEAAELTLHILKGMSIADNDDGIKLDEDNLQNIENFYGTLDTECIQTLTNDIVRESFLKRYAQGGETIVITPDNAQKIEDVYGTDISKSQAINNLIAKGWKEGNK